MKLFFAVLAAILAAGFISWLTLSLAKIAQHQDALRKKAHEENVQPPH
jgi:hypothetical protein